MITVFVTDCNQFSQSFYNSVINSIQFHRLTCSCGHSGCLHIHGYYNRSVKTPSGKQFLRICRLQCFECKSTHAILLSSLVPYSQISLLDQRQICIDYDTGKSPADLCEQNPLIDENNVKSVRRAYRRRWKEMLLSLHISFFPIPQLILSCFSLYSAQFMQIHHGTNLLFSLTT